MIPGHASPCWTPAFFSSRGLVASPELAFRAKTRLRGEAPRLVPERAEDVEQGAGVSRVPPLWWTSRARNCRHKAHGRRSLAIGAAQLTNLILYCTPLPRLLFASRPPPLCFEQFCSLLFRRLGKIHRSNERYFSSIDIRTSSLTPQRVRRLSRCRRPSWRRRCPRPG